MSTQNVKRRLRLKTNAAAMALVGVVAAGCSESASRFADPLFTSSVPQEPISTSQSFGIQTNGQTVLEPSTRRSRAVVPQRIDGANASVGGANTFNARGVTRSAKQAGQIPTPRLESFGTPQRVDAVASLAPRATGGQPTAVSRLPQTTSAISRRAVPPISTASVARNDVNEAATPLLARRSVAEPALGVSGSTALGSGQNGTQWTKKYSPLPTKAPSGETPSAYTPPAAAVSSSGARSGQTVELRPGETLSAVSRRYGISVNDLAAANDITNPSAVYAGQKLVIPGAGAKKAATQVASLGSSAVRSDTKPLVTKSRDKEISYKGAYKVSKGDTLSAVAARHGVRVADLKAANGIGEGDVIKIGQTLSVPGTANTTQIASVDRVKTAAVPKATTPKQRVAAKTVESVSKRVSLAPAVPSAAVSKPEAITQTDVASVNPSAGLPRLDGGEAASKAAPAKPYTTPKLAADKAVKQAKKPVTASGASFKWPVRGEMISGFGRSSDGTTNDGINIKVPAGTPVRATAAGEVIYAADGLAGYGKLVLIRHSNGFVSAYGHNSDLKVRRGDRVRQGQVVASSGDTGSVNSPQVHFELREGKRPVDPLAHLAS